jgi:Ran GTPase-activating protein (RanGAP) involved in mRNA processing and transport
MVTSSLIEAVCVQNQIVMLDISENIVSVESINYLMQNSTSLCDLVIENCGLSGEDIKKILQIAKNSTISGLFVSYNPITKPNIKGILELFTHTNLKNIGLSGLPFEESDVRDICNLINKKPNLEILHLAHVEISEQGMSRVLDSLCKHEDLKEIDLTGTSLHIPHVCVVIETCCSLKTIVLREIIVSQRDYSFLAETIKKSPQLEVCLLDN